MSNRKVEDYLQDIIDAINATEQFILGFDFI